MLGDADKEIRFTRSQQALPWGILAAASAAAIVIGTTGALLPAPYGAAELKQWWPLLPPLFTLFIFSSLLCWRCTRRAYLIFSSIGVEIFPFWKAEKNLNVILWQEIHHLNLVNGFLMIHFNAEESAGAAVSLRPIPSKKHLLIKKITEKNLSPDHSSDEKK